MTSPYAETAAALRSHFQTSVAAALPLVTVYDNDSVGPQTSRWCRFVIEFYPSAVQTSTGSPASRRYRMTGRCVALLFEPVGNGKAKGDGAQLELCDTIDVAFRSISLGTTVQITVGVPAPVGPPEVDSETWWRRRLEIPFRVDYAGSSSET